MITGSIRSQIDQIWNAFWSGGVSNPLSVIEQLTFLMFIKRLDDLHTVEAHYTTPALKRFLMAYFGPLMRGLPPIRRRRRNSSRPVLNHDFEQ